MTVNTSRRPTVFLHIGPMKTGTSYLQQLMADNQEALRSQGVLFPGRDPRIDQVRGVRDVMGLYPEQERPAELKGAWAGLRDEMFAFPGRASVVSSEFMSFARTPRAEAILRSLEPAAVHVVLTVRDASRVLPSSWATATRNRGTASWQEYVDALLAGPDAGGVQWRRSMRALDVPRMLQTWGRLVSPDRLHVVVVPASGAPPDALWARFARALGVDSTGFDVTAERRGESYGYFSADLMRRVNSNLLDLPKPVYHRAKKHLLEEVLDRRTGEPRVPVTRTVAEFALRWNAVTAEAVTASGARVDGQLADLNQPPSELAGTAAPPSAQELLPVAVEALSRLGCQDAVQPTAVNAPDELAVAVRTIAEAMRRSQNLPL